MFIINDGFDFRQGNYNAPAAFFYERVSQFIQSEYEKLHCEIPFPLHAYRFLLEPYPVTYGPISVGQLSSSSFDIVGAYS